MCYAVSAVVLCMSSAILGHLCFISDTVEEIGVP